MRSQIQILQLLRFGNTGCRDLITFSDGGRHFELEFADSISIMLCIQFKSNYLKIYIYSSYFFGIKLSLSCLKQYQIELIDWYIIGEYLLSIIVYVIPIIIKFIHLLFSKTL